MLDNDGIGSLQHGQGREQEEASQQVTRLTVVAADEKAINQVVGGATRRQRALGSFARPTLTSRTPDARDELALAIAEIERASEALREWEPALERGLPSLPKRRRPRAYWAVWLMIETHLDVERPHDRERHRGYSVSVALITPPRNPGLSAREIRVCLSRISLR